MRTTKLKSMAEFLRVFRKDTRELERGLDRAMKRAARKTAAHVRRNVPVAFSELRDSVHVKGSSVIVDAPHAAAVEWGSRPHWAPLAPLVKWVKLRGFQGLQAEGSRRRVSGTTTFSQATGVAGQIRDLMMTDGSDASPIDAPMQVARAIQLSIALKGTKPQFYMAKAVPHARGFLGVEVEATLRSNRKAA